MEEELKAHRIRARETRFNTGILLISVGLILSLILPIYWSVQYKEPARVEFEETIQEIENTLRSDYERLHQLRSLKPENRIEFNNGLQQARDHAENIFKLDFSIPFIGISSKYLNSYFDILHQLDIFSVKNINKNKKQLRSMKTIDENVRIKIGYISGKWNEFTSKINEDITARLLLVEFFWVTSIVSIGILQFQKTAPKRKEALRLSKESFRLKMEAKEKAYYETLRNNPLMYHHVCTNCGWLGRLGTGPTGPSGAGGTVAAVGGTAVAGLGVVGIVIGGILILIGLPLLFVFGLGIIPIGIGIMMITAGGTATTAGATVATAGAGAASDAASVRAAIAQAPRQCPACKNVGLIPAIAPIAQNLIQSTPAVANMALAEVENVLRSIPERKEVS